MVMQIYSIEFTKIPDLPKTVCCIGFFDGLHKGHQLLLKTTLEEARKKHLPSGVILFDPDPWTLFHPDEEMDHLTPIEKREAMFQEAGIDILYIMHFTKEFAALTYEDFHELLFDMHVQALVCGTDFHYASHNSGSIHTLKAQERIEIIAIEPLMEDQIEKISSSKIEKEIEAGRIEEANASLGYMYSIDGTIRHGFQRGSKILNIPTANLEPDSLFTLPAIGVYAGYMKLKNSYYPAMINIGFNPTFGNTHKSIEAHVLDFDQDLYGKKVSFLFVQKIRPEHKFDSIEALKTQLKQDIETTRQILAKKSIQDWSSVINLL